MSQSDSGKYSENVYMDLEYSDPYSERAAAAANNNSEKHDCKFHRKRLRRGLESKLLHKFIIFLIALDLIAVILDLILEAHVKQACAPPSHEYEIGELFLHYLSVSILGIFEVEMILRIFAWGWRFFCNIGHLFDMVVITVALVLEVTLHNREGEDIIGLLIVLRLWRIVRIIQAIVEVEGVHHKATQHLLRRSLKSNEIMRGIVEKALKGGEITKKDKKELEKIVVQSKRVHNTSAQHLQFSERREKAGWCRICCHPKCYGTPKKVDHELSDVPPGNPEASA